MAASITVTTSRLKGGISKYSCAWTSHTDGTVASINVPVQAGFLEQVKFIPGSGGTQPTDLYDATLLDADSVDLLGGAGANLSNAAASIKGPAIGTYFKPFVEEGNLQPTIAAAGSGKTGTMIIYIRG